MTHVRTTDNSPESPLTTLLMPIQGNQRLVIPNITMAELASGETPAEPAPDNSPDWVAGLLNWRGRQLPIVRWEGLCGQTRETDSDEIRFAVLNRLYDDYSEPFYALLVQSIPSMLRVAPDSLPVVEGPATGALFTVETDAGHAIIPDLEWLEQQLAAAFD